MLLKYNIYIMGDKCFKKSQGRFRSCKDKSRRQTFHCLICNDEVVPNTGYNILKTLMPHDRGILCDDINRVLHREIDAVTARSTILCNRCFALFIELSAAEKRCIEIRNELTQYYMETSHMYEDCKPMSVPGIASQTDMELDDNSDIKKKHEDKLPARKRGRPRKSDVNEPNKKLDIENKKDIPVSDEFNSVKMEMETEVLFIKDEENSAIIESVSNGLDQENSDSKSPFSSKSADLNTVKNSSKYIVAKRKSKIPKRNLELSNTQISNNGRGPNASDNEDSGTGSNSNDLTCIQSNQEGVDNVFTKDYYSCDDDFEWKEEDNVSTLAHKLSKENETNEHTSSSGCGKVKKRKHKNRKGERAFIVPTHSCEVCEKKWRTVAELKSHMASHSKIRPYVCEICGQAYKLKKALDVHVGMHNGIHPFLCHYCNKSFTQKVGLEKHLPIHTGVSRYQCDLCGKRFIHEKSLNIHNMTHTGVKNIHCPVCNLALFSQSHLKRHYRVHTGEKPYGCTICGKKFAEKYNLNAHVKIHDPNIGGESRRRGCSNTRVLSTQSRICPICGAEFIHKKKLTEHLKTAHSVWKDKVTNEEETIDAPESDESKSEGPQQLMKDVSDEKTVSIIESELEVNTPTQCAIPNSDDNRNGSHYGLQSSPQRCPSALSQTSHDPLEHHFLISRSDFSSTTFVPVTTLAPAKPPAEHSDQNLVTMQSTITPVSSFEEHSHHCSDSDNNSRIQMSSLQLAESSSLQQECEHTSDSSPHSSLLRSALQNFMIPQAQFSPTFSPSPAVVSVPMYDSSQTDTISPMFQLVIPANAVTTAIVSNDANNDQTTTIPMASL